MKVIGLSISGIRKLKAVEMKFEEKGGLIQIKGKNRQGKTSVLDALEILLRGTSYLEKDMITHGEDRAEIIAEIGEYRVKRVITGKSNRIEITNKDGLKVASKPQAFLDKLVNSLTFDPRPFLNKTPDQKLKFMMDLFNIDFSKEDEEIRDKESERLFIGRTIKKEIPVVAKEQEIDTKALVARESEINRHNNELHKNYESTKTETVKAVYKFNAEQEKIHDDKITKKDDLEKMEADRNRLIEELARLDSEMENCVETLKSMPDAEPEKKLEEEIEKIKKPDYIETELEEIAVKLKDAEETNRKAKVYQEYLKVIKDEETKKANYDKLTEQIKTIRESKKKKLTEIKIPVEGLEIREDGIYHNNIFSENWSESEGLKLSSQLCVSMDPKLRAVFIDKAESYDNKSLKDLEEWAVNNDIQAFLTIVSDDQPDDEEGVIYIEEGEVVNGSSRS
jgi:DNA repair exonuclease SbcCD ATPase subunit